MSTCYDEFKQTYKNQHWEVKFNAGLNKIGDDVDVIETDITDLRAESEMLANKDTDGTLAADSDTKYSSQKAVKAYVDGATVALINLPLTADGIIPTIIDADLRVLAGIYLNGVSFPVPMTDPVEVAKLAEMVDLPLTLEGVIPIVVDADLRVLAGTNLDGSSYPYSAAPAVYDTIFPNDARLLVSDYLGISEQSANRLRFIRPLMWLNYEQCSPGSRVGFMTDALTVKATVYFNNLLTGGLNYTGAILADGSVVATFGRPSAPATVVAECTFGSAAVRLIEIIWPYGDGMDLVKIQVSQGAGISVPPARPTTKLLVAGDSITEGFYATDVLHSWPWLVAVSKGWQLLNLGYNGRQANAADGSTLAGTGANVVLYMIGYNNFAIQTPLATFKAAVSGWLTNARAALPTVPIFAGGPFYTTHTDTLTPAMYRTQVADAIADLADGNIYYVDGLALLTNNNDRLQDTVHPNNLGASEIATALEAILHT